MKLCQSVLSLSLSDLDPTKNISTVLSAEPHLLLKLIHRIDQTIRSLTQRLSVVREESVEKHVVPCLSLMLGLHAPYRMTYPPQIHAAFRVIRILLLDCSNTKNNLFSVLSRNLGEMAARRFMDNVVDDSDVSNGIISSTKRAHQREGCISDQIVTICYSVIHVDEDAGAVRSRSGRFCRDVLAVPMVTCLLSKECISNSIATATSLEMMSNVFNNISQLALPASPFPVFKSGQWLLGNLASLGPYLSLSSPVAPPPPPPRDDRKSSSGSNPGDQEPLPNSLLVSYFNLLSALLVRYNVPGVWGGKCGVVWAREGAVLQASAVPKALQMQLLALLDSSFLRTLYMRCVRPFPLPVGNDFQDSSEQKRLTKLPRCMRPLVPCEKDVAEVREALGSTGLTLIRSTLQEEQEASTLLGGGSKWASKIFSSIKDAFSSGQSRAPTSQQASEASRSSRLDTAPDGKTSTSDDEEPSVFPPNEEVVLALARMWSLILPAAASAPHESACWKGLATLAFSTKALGRLWGVAVSAAANSSHGTSNPLASALCFASVGNEFSVERDMYPGAGGGFAVLVNVAAVMRLSCIVLDDAELYDKGVSNCECLIYLILIRQCRIDPSTASTFAPVRSGLELHSVQLCSGESVSPSQRCGSSYCGGCWQERRRCDEQ